VLKYPGWVGRLRPDGVFQRPGEWIPISRIEAARLMRTTPVVVVFVGRGAEQAAWFNEQSPFFQSVRSYNIKNLRYYRFSGKAPEMRGGTARGISVLEPAAPIVAAPVAPPKPKKETAWIEIELVGEDDSPVGGERFRLVLPDGSTREGILDPMGRARIEGIDPGTCKVSFPNLDEEAWAVA
jgi:hypothetical protein